VGSVKLINNIINQRGTPAFNSNTLANRPAAGYVGRIFISTDTFVIQRDNGTTWDNIGGGGGISGTGAAGQVTFWTSASAVSGDNAFHWDNVNKRLGLGTIAPGVRLDIHGTGVIQQLNGTGTNSAFLDFQNAGTSRWRIGNNYNGAANDYVIFNNNTLINGAVIKNNGQMLFNSPDLTPSPVNNFIEFYRINSSAIALALLDYSNANNGNGINFFKTRGTTKGSYSATLNSDALGVFSAYGSTNTNFTGSSYFGVYQAGTVATYAPGEITFDVTNGSAYVRKLTLHPNGYSTFIDRINVNNATDNALFELNNNGNFYTGGLSPTILTVNTNTTMARTVTGYYVTSTATLTLPSAASLNNVYWIIAASGVTVTVNRAGSDDILNLAGTSVTSITITSNQRAMFYVGGGTRTFLISQA
jgi:hypothetical protein